MSVATEIMNNVREKASKEPLVGYVKYIKIQPELLHQISVDPEIVKSFRFNEGEYSIYNIPLLPDVKVEKWEIVY